MPETKNISGPTRGDTAGGDSAARSNERRPVTVVYETENYDGVGETRVIFFKQADGLEGSDKWVSDMQFVADVTRRHFVIIRIYRDILDEGRAVGQALGQINRPWDHDTGEALAGLIQAIRHNFEKDDQRRKFEALREAFPDEWRRGLIWAGREPITGAVE